MKWASLMKNPPNFHNKKSPKLKRYVRKGIPGIYIEKREKKSFLSLHKSELCVWMELNHVLCLRFFFFVSHMNRNWNPDCVCFVGRLTTVKHSWKVVKRCNYITELSILCSGSWGFLWTDIFILCGYTCNHINFVQNRRILIHWRIWWNDEMPVAFEQCAVRTLRLFVHLCVRVCFYACFPALGTMWHTMCS